MTTDEWLQALRDAHKPQNADGLTSQELAQAWGVAVNTALATHQATDSVRPCKIQRVQKHAVHNRRTH